MKILHNKYLILILLILIISILIALITNNYNKRTINNNLEVTNPNSKIVADFWNRGVTINDIPQNIVCLSPAVVEFICEMGYQDRIIGVSKEINYPENIVSITPVAHYDEIDVNKILELKPDIIFASKYTYIEICDIFTGNNIPIVYIEPNNYEEMFRSLEILGEIFEEKDKINDIKNNLKTNVEDITKSNDISYKPNVLFVQNLSPLYVAGNNTFINDIISLNGGKNIAKSQDGFYEIDSEFIMNNEINILVFSSKFKDEVTMDYVINESIFKDTYASQNENVFFVINEELYMNPTLRLSKPINEINSQIKLFNEKLVLENNND